MPQADDTQAQSIMAGVRRVAPHLLQRVQQGLSNLELIHTPHSTWPLPHGNHVQQYNPRRPLRVSILDSSFNPPTLAHLALANSCRVEGDSFYRTGEPKELSAPAYDAKLLLLSVKNADKTLKPGDASYLQRLVMMSLLINDLKPDSGDLPITTPDSSNLTPGQLANVAIAIIDEPTFVGKSEAFRAFLKHRFCQPQFTQQDIAIDSVELSFLVGLDTLERLFSPRYYPSETDMMSKLHKFLSPSPEGDNARIVSARRTMTQSDIIQPKDNSLERAKPFMEAGRIAVIDIGRDISTYSSTTVRRSLNSVGLSGDSVWRKLVTKSVADYILENELYQAGP
ncbi:hypothetical protein D9613_007927 [Agrocybe pediades]|uniref:Nicotinamide-nucleotide adenylyltransferase n=1 Tax=Agrocybe pediades TaxID=84607 RepID=A0A8H4QNL2_9AGAR|nr:hypothetical protein D9613_007927 [Agrocybe pediades]